MPEFLLAFIDGEVIAGQTDLIDFHRSILQVTATEPGGNNREMLVPLTSIKYIVFGGEEDLTEAVEDLGKVVIHFNDHEIMRAYAERDTLGGPLGVIYNLVDPQRRVRRRIGIPYTAVKAIFRVQSWDSRSRRTGLTYERVAQILARREDTARVERVGRPVQRPRRRPLLDRTTRA